MNPLYYYETSQYLSGSRTHVCEHLPRHAAYKAACAGGLLSSIRCNWLGEVIVNECATGSMECNAHNKVTHVSSEQLFACIIIVPTANINDA